MLHINYLLQFTDYAYLFYRVGLNVHYWCIQANLAVQEARYEAAMKDLNKAQAQLDEKQAELEAVQAQYDQAMLEKQVSQSPAIAYMYIACIIWSLQILLGQVLLGQILLDQIGLHLVRLLC